MTLWQHQYISTLDAIRTIIQDPPKTVRRALSKLLQQEEKREKTLEQQRYVKESLTRAFDELKEARRTGRKLPDARTLFQ